MGSAPVHNQTDNSVQIWTDTSVHKQINISVQNQVANSVQNQVDNSVQNEEDASVQNQIDAFEHHRKVSHLSITEERKQLNHKHRYILMQFLKQQFNCPTGTRFTLLHQVQTPSTRDIPLEHRTHYGNTHISPVNSPSNAH